MITFMDFKALKSLATLRTLNVLNTLTVRKADRSPPPPDTAVISNSTIEIETTPPSSQFILSARYFFGPTAKTFEVSSPMKIQVKIEPANSKSAAISKSILYFSIPMMIVFNKTHAVKALSNKLCLTIIFNKTLAFFKALVGPLGHTLTALIESTTHVDRSVVRPIYKTSWPDQVGVLRLRAQSALKTSSKLT